MQTEVLIVQLAARFNHKPPAAWFIKAYCAEKGLLVDVLEANINAPLPEVVDAVVFKRPRIVGVSCYIWNIELAQKLALDIKKLLPETVIVFGGPEVSFAEETDYKMADYIVQGEGEARSYLLYQAILSGKAPKERLQKSVHVPLCDLPNFLTESYFASVDEKLMPHMLVYYESSRGCPFSCGYCLSAAGHGLEHLPIERVKEDVQLLVRHGAKCIKFTDRTFNSDKKRAAELLKFFGSLDTDAVFHMEVAPDLIDDSFLDVLKTLPPGRVQIEAGIQSVKDETLAAVTRKQNTKKALEQIKKVSDIGNCHIHTDLIVGLPGDSLSDIEEGVNACVATGAHMVQLGFLKMLHGSPLRAKAKEMGLIYSDYPPYEILQTPLLSYETIRKLDKIAHVIDRVLGTGQFSHIMSYGTEIFGAPFSFFEAIAEHPLPAGQKAIYTLLYDILRQKGTEEKAAHVVKLDCLTHDPKAQLPDGIPPLWDKEKEKEHKKTGQTVRAAFFPYDGQTRVFIHKNLKGEQKK